MDTLFDGHRQYKDSLEKIEVSGLSYKEIMQKFDLSKTSAWRAEKRGFFLKGYGDCKKVPKAKRERTGEYIFALNPKLYFYIFNLNLEEKMRDYLLTYFTTKRFELNNPIAYVNWFVRNRLRDNRQY